MKQKRPHTLLNQGAKKPRIFQCYFHLVFCRFSLKLSSSPQILTAQGKEFDFASWKQSQISTKKSLKTQIFFFFLKQMEQICTSFSNLTFLYQPSPSSGISDVCVIAEFSKSHQKSLNSVQKYFIFVSIEPLSINIQVPASWQLKWRHRGIFPSEGISYLARDCDKSYTYNQYFQSNSSLPANPNNSSIKLLFSIQIQNSQSFWKMYCIALYLMDN